MRRRRAVLALAVAGLVGACATVQDRRDEAFRLIGEAHWSSAILSAGAFDLLAARSPAPPSGTLVVYLEGDGFAYIRPNRPSSDPTPADPVALRMALADTLGAPVAYLARPCQYVTGIHRRHCSVDDWTGRRYAPEVVEAAGLALDQLKQQVEASRLVLVGYSGGGALAVLLAAQRHDVAAVVTAAANLDLAYWTGRDRLAPLTGSLDPADAAPRLGNLQQIHFAGDADRAVGADVTRAYLRHLPAGAPARLIEVPGFTHACCWAEQWLALQRLFKWGEIVPRE